MRNPFLPVFRRPLALLAASLLPATGVAQTTDAGPGRGTWGAEAVASSSGFGASLLRFRSPTSAWIAGVVAAGAVGEERRPSPTGTTVERTSSVSTSARIGIRRYGAPARLRSLGAAGLLGHYRFRRGESVGWSAGIWGELGAAYFFSPHLSLGGSGEMRVSYGEVRFGRYRDRDVTLQATLVRVLGAVYF